MVIYKKNIRTIEFNPIQFNFEKIAEDLKPMKLRIAYLTILLILLFSLTPDISANHPIVTGDDEWLRVRTKNFHLIGNAKEKELRGVATKLEQFRAVFRLLFPRVKFNQSIETNVVVFKSKKSYKPFLPKDGEGKPDEGIAGYFQPGEDVNYITLSTEGGKDDTYGVIFHEYVHFLVNTNIGRSAIPPWFNEGLAEYYQTFTIEDDQKVYLGNLQEGHLYLLQKYQLIPLKDFFSIDNYSLHQNGNHSRSIFYAQAWALMHYLIQTKQNENMGKFLDAVMAEVEPEKAFRDSFGIEYEAMEKTLKEYAKQRRFNISFVKFNNKLLFDSEMTVEPLSEAGANAYLGDLLYHSNQYVDAEVYLQKSISLDPNESLANNTLGLVRLNERKFDEARKHLEKAIAGNRRNHYAYYNYAYVLSRESVDEFGRVTGYPPETAKIMRKSLIEAININPNFTESYRLLAFINLVNNEELDQAINYLNKALSIQPGNLEYSLTIAQIYLQQEKFDEAEKIGLKLSRSAVDEKTRAEVQGLLSSVQSLRANAAEIAKYKKNSKDREENRFNERPDLKNKSTLTEEEIKKIELENELISLNRRIKKPKNGELQIVGFTQKIECLRGGVKYTIKTDDGTAFLKSLDFQSLELLSLTEEANNALVGCDADMKEFKTVYTYRAEKDSNLKTDGNLVGMVYVPKLFQMKSAEELANAQTVMIVDDEAQRDQMMNALKASLYKPKGDEKQVLGVLEKIECNKNMMFFRFKTDGQEMIFKTDSPQNLPIQIYTRDAAGMRFGCGMRPADTKVLVTYRPSEKDSNKSQGDVITLEFMPENFELK